MIEQQIPLNTQHSPERPRESDFGVSQILKIIFRRKFGITAIVLLTLIAALFYHYSQTPEYHAVAVMMIKDSKGANDMLSAVIGGQTADNISVKKDVKLLKSMPIAEMTVRDLYKSSRKDSLEFFGKRQYHPPTETLLKSVSSFYEGLELNPVTSWNELIQTKPLTSYNKSIKLKFIPPYNEWLQVKPIVPVNFFVQSTNTKVAQPKKKKEDPDVVFRSYVQNLNSRIRVDLDRETNVLDVSVTSPFSDEAVFLSNTLCRVYKEADISRNSEKYSQASTFIAEMLQKQQKKVADVDKAMTLYMKGHEIYEVTGNTQKLLDKLIETDAKYNEILTEYRITKNSLDFLDKKLTAADKEKSVLIAQNVNSQLGAIMDEMKSSERDYMQLLQERGDNDAEVKAKRQALDVVKTRYDQLSRSKIAGQIGYAGKAQKISFDLVSEKIQIEKKLNNLNFSSMEFSRLKQYYEKQLSTLPNKQQEYASLLRDREVINKTYIFLKEKLDETGILLGSEVGSVALIGSAFRPSAPEKPVLKKDILTGLVLGLLLAAIYTYGAETFEDTINDETFFKDIGIPLLSVIPVVTQRGRSAFSLEHFSRIRRFFYNRSKTFRKKVLTTETESLSKHRDIGKATKIAMPMITDNMSSSFAESFRILRTSLEYTRINGKLKSILVSGTAMTEGKSTVCSNLAMAYALIGKKTLIIDCDLRRASQHEKLSSTREPGLTDYLFSQDHTIDERSIKPTQVENLFLLTAGKKVPNPNELLASPKMIDLLTELEGKFDMLVLDSPPLFLSDAAELARSVDGTLLVARLKYSSKRPLQEFSMDPFLRPLMLGLVTIAPHGSALYEYGKYGYGKYGYGKYEEKS